MADSGLPQRSSRTRDERRLHRRNRQHQPTDDNDNHDLSTTPLPHTPPPASTVDANEPQPMLLSTTADEQATNSPASSSTAPCFEFLDHTADVQFHAWGDSLAAAFANLSLCMHSFLVDRPLPSQQRVTAVVPFVLSSHSLPSLLFAFLDESLYLFLTRDLLITDVRVRQLLQTDHSWLVNGEWRGVTYDGDVHGRGTEVKAITYSNMQLYVHGKRVGEEAGTDDGDGGGEKKASATMHGADLYVIVDI